MEPNKELEALGLLEKAVDLGTAKGAYQKMEIVIFVNAIKHLNDYINSNNIQKISNPS